MGEIVTAEAADGSIQVQSPQTEPTPKSNGDKESETTETDSAPTQHKPKARKSSITSKTGEAKLKTPEVNERGVVKTQWDNPEADPNARRHIGEDPTGESNLFEGH